MREFFTMWKHTKMVVLAAVTAALYAGLMLPFKGIQIIPGFVEPRPAACIPVVFGMLFGPAAAWGAAVGNVIGDTLGGQLGPGSLFGFVGNFLLAAIPFALYKSFTKTEALGVPKLAGRGSWLAFSGTTVTASAACAAAIATGLDAIRFFPYVYVATSIFVNNVVMPLAIGPVLLGLLSGRVRRWGVFWRDVMRPIEISRGIAPRLFSSVQIASVIGSFVAGYFVSMTAYGAKLAQAYDFGAGPMGPKVPIFVAPFLAIVIICFFFE